MNELARFQSDLLAASFKQNKTSAPRLLKQLRGNNALTPQLQLKIYENSIQNGLINALGQIYPVCQLITGENFFYPMAQQFVLEQPSSNADLAEYGKSFTDMIANYKHASSIPYLADIARLEWAYHRAFHARDQAPLNLQGLQGNTSEALLQCVFTLPESHCLLQSSYPVDKIWQAHQTAPINTLHINTHPRYFYIFRNSYSIHIDRLTQQQWKFLTLIEQQQTFEQVCEKLDDNANITELLSFSLQSHWFNGLT